MKRSPPLILRILMAPVALLALTSSSWAQMKIVWDKEFRNPDGIKKVFYMVTDGTTLNPKTFFGLVVIDTSLSRNDEFYLKGMNFDYRDVRTILEAIEKFQTAQPAAPSRLSNGTHITQKNSQIIFDNTRGTQDPAVYLRLNKDEATYLAKILANLPQHFASASPYQRETFQLVEDPSLEEMLRQN